MRIVKVFVSSLFKEMMTERDILHRQVNALIAEQLGMSTDISVEFIDLRWGIDSRNKKLGVEASDYIVEKCFEAIDDCDIFLGMISSGYGTVADKSVIKKHFPFAEDDESYTTIEIRYAMEHFSKNNMIFMLTSPSETDHTKLIELKKIIIEKYTTRYYSKENKNEEICISDDFVTGIADMICGVIKSRFFEDKKIRSDAWFPRVNVIEKCVNSANKHNIVLLTGASGCGKSVLLNMVYKRLSGCNYRFFLSSGFGDGDARLLENDLQKWTGIEDTLEKKLQAFQQIIQNSDDPCIVFLDSIDDMDISVFYVLYSKIIQLPAEKVTMYISTSSVDKIEYLSGLNIHYIDVERLENEELIPYMKHIAAESNKDLFDEVCDAILLHGDAIYNALYLRTLIHQMVIMTSGDYRQTENGEEYINGLIQRMISIVESAPADIEEIILWKLNDIDQYLNSDFSSFLFELMCVYQVPISLSLMKIIYEDFYQEKWSDMNYYMYRYYLKGFVSEQEGKLFFSHNFVRKCVQTVYADIDEKKYMQIIMKGLKQSGSDYKMMCYFAGIIEPDFLIQELKDTRNLHEKYQALASLFFVSLLDTSCLFYNLFERICDSCGTEAAGEFLIELIQKTDLHKFSNEGADFYVKAFEIIDRKNNNPDLTMKLLKAMSANFHDNGISIYAPKVIDRFFRLIHEEKGLGGFVQRIPDDTEICVFYIYRLLVALDNFDIGSEVFDLVVQFAESGKSLKVFYPAVVEGLLKTSLDKAYELSCILIDRFKGVETDYERAVYGNLLYAYITVLAIKKEYDNMYATVNELHQLFYEQYEKDNLNEQYAYNYSLALSALITTPKINDNPEVKKRTYGELIALRIHLCKLSPNNIVFLSALSNTILQSIINNEDTGYDKEYLLETLYEFILDMAHRGNPQACWMISSILKLADKTVMLYKFFIDKLNEIDIFLEPIMRLNRGKKNLVEEIVYTYLQIYHNYCSMGILPFQNGHHLLHQLLEFVKLELLESETDMDYAIMLFEIFKELVSIQVSEMQDADASVKLLYSRECADYRKFVEEQHTKNKSIVTEFLLAGADVADIMIYLSVWMNIQKFGEKQIQMFVDLTERLNLNVDKMIVEMCCNVLTTIEKLFSLNISIPSEFWAITFAGSTFVKNTFSESEHSSRAAEVVERINTLLPGAFSSNNE